MRHESILLTTLLSNGRQILLVSLIASQKNGYRFILTEIDSFSRYAWARALRIKSGKQVTVAFEDIFKEGRIPRRMQTDQGNEFENRDVLALSAKHNTESFTGKWSGLMAR